MNTGNAPDASVWQLPGSQPIAGAPTWCFSQETTFPAIYSNSNLNFGPAWQRHNTQDVCAQVLFRHVGRKDPIATSAGGHAAPFCHTSLLLVLKSHLLEAPLHLLEACSKEAAPPLRARDDHVALVAYQRGAAPGRFRASSASARSTPSLPDRPPLSRTTMHLVRGWRSEQNRQQQLPNRQEREELLPPYTIIYHCIP